MGRLKNKKQRRATELWSGRATVGTLVLSKSITEFDFISFEFQTEHSGDEVIETTVSSKFLSALPINSVFFAGGMSNKYITLKKLSDSSFSMQYSSYLNVRKISGIKEV